MYPSDKLEISQFTLIAELLDSNMDNQDIFIGRGELTDFVSEELLKDDVFDLLDSNDEESDDVKSKATVELLH